MQHPRGGERQLHRRFPTWERRRAGGYGARRVLVVQAPARRPADRHQRAGPPAPQETDRAADVLVGRHLVDRLRHRGNPLRGGAGSSSVALGLAKLVPLSIVVAILLAIVVASYRQTLFAYPSGGGSYIVSRENLGEYPSLIAGASLLVDYILTVAVSISA